MTDINYSQYRMLCKINKVTKINPNDLINVVSGKVEYIIK